MKTEKHKKLKFQNILTKFDKIQLPIPGAATPSSSPTESRVSGALGAGVAKNYFPFVLSLKTKVVKKIKFKNSKQLSRSYQTRENKKTTLLCSVEIYVFLLNF